MTQLRAHWTGLTISAVLSVVLSVAGSVQAQTDDMGPRPVLSPWFGLYQRNGGPLDNYHTFVRPKIAINDTFQQQQSAIQHNNAGINSLGQDVLQLQEPGTVRPTGTASVFMNYSHYYPTHARGGQALHNQAIQRPPTRPGTQLPPGRATR